MNFLERLPPMASPAEISAEISELTQHGTTNITPRAQHAAVDELRTFLLVIILIVAQLHPEKQILGNKDPCGPSFNRCSSLPL